MLLDSVPYCAPFDDARAGIRMVLRAGAIESCVSKFKVPAKVAFQPLAVQALAGKLSAAGLAASLPIAPLLATNLKMEIEQPSPRNKKSRVPPSVQLEIYRAAEAKRARKQAQRMLDSGASIEDEL